MEYNEGIGTREDKNYVLPNGAKPWSSENLQSPCRTHRLTVLSPLSPKAGKIKSQNSDKNTISE
jgi:hypothetical protein